MIPKTTATTATTTTATTAPKTQEQGANVSGMLGTLKFVPPMTERVAGHLLSRRPTMTPAKRERIAEKIRAQQRAAQTPAETTETAAEQPLTSSAQRANYPLGEFMGSMADSLWTCTQWAAEKLYGPSTPGPTDGGQPGTSRAAGDLSATSATAQCDVQVSDSAKPAAGSRSVTISKEDFLNSCVKNGFSKDDAKKIEQSLVRRGIPLSEKTVPVLGNHNVVDGKLTKKPGVSTSIDAEHYRGLFEVDGQQKYHWVKCYPLPAGAGYVEDHLAYQKDLGIDNTRPFYEGRVMLASTLCKLLGWSVVPPVHFGFINGAPCTVTEYVKGESLANLAQQDPRLIDHVGSLASGKIRGADYPGLGPEVKLDLARLAVLGTLLGNKDMHMNQIYFPDTDAKSKQPPKSAQVYDWDTSCGKRTRTVKDVYAAVPGTYYVGTKKPLPSSKAGFWPADEYVKNIREEFLQKITPEVLREQAAGLIDKEEIEALVDRFQSIRALLEAA